MSIKSSGSDSSSDGSNVTRFTLDGVVAEMVVEVDDDHDPLLSPSKALKLNGLDNYERLKASALRRSYVALDRMTNMDDIKITNESPEQKDLHSKEDETDSFSKESQEIKIPLKSNDLSEQGTSINEESDLSKEKESDVLDVDRMIKLTEAAEMPCKDINETSKDKIAVEDVTETNDCELPEQNKAESPVEEAVETVEDQSLEENENEPSFEDAAKTDAAQRTEKNESEPAFEGASKSDEVQVIEKNENKLAFADAPETNEVQATKKNEIEQVCEDAPQTDQIESLEKNDNKSANEDATEINVAQPQEKAESEFNFETATKTDGTQLSGKNDHKSAVEEKTETNEIWSSDKDESKTTFDELVEINETPSSDKDENKTALDRMTETIVVGCESTGMEMKDVKEPPGAKKFLKLPIKKRKLKELVKSEEDDKNESEPRALRTRPSEKEKQEVNTKGKRKREDSSKSAPTPVKKAKIVKEENSKKGVKRKLPEEEKTGGTAAKRLRTTTQDNSQMRRRSQVSNSAKKPDVKDKKPDMKDKKPEAKNKKPEIKNKKLEIKNTKPEKKNKKPEIKNKKLEIKNKKPKIKRQSLRKATLQKTASLSTPVASPKPKVYNLNRGKVTNLGVFSEIKERMNQSDMKYLRYLYRILYDQWPPKDIDELKEEILKFEGFNFKKKSQELQKREQMLKKMPDNSIAEVCKILDLKVDSKENMISDIIKFLLKPVKIVISTVDPFDLSMQPSVKLERISLDAYLNKTVKKEKGTPVPVKRSKRERFPSTKLEIYVSDVTEKTPVSSTKSDQKSLHPEIKIEKGAKGETSKNIVMKQSTVSKRKVKIVQKGPLRVKKGSMAAKFVQKGSLRVKKGSMAAKFVRRRKKVNLTQKKKSSTENARKKLMKLALKIQKTKSPVKSNSEVESIDNTIIPESEIKLEPIVEDVREVEKPNEVEESEATKSNDTNVVPKESRSRESSSDATLSSDEAKQITKTDSPRKRVSHKRVGKPLRYFTKIKENILNANFSALQRLHILLFGASDKADNLKGNILAFGGFPFLEGSEEWKQKEFLLSLLAQNTLREYLNLLCIEYSDDDQKLLITKLMKFLAAPSDKSLDDEIRTQVISSEPVSRAPVHTTKVPLQKKKTKKVEKKTARTRKVLMDEAQVKRLEADLAREQRILERERRLHEEKAKKLQAKPPATEKPALESNKNIKSFIIKDGMESDESLEKKAALTAKQTDAELLNALLQTVYKRRALKKAGVVISAPKKETLTRLGELANVKFLVVTANYSDLDVLHHLIYMTEANKAKVRKNILDFAGFNFAEDSNAYKDRMAFLNSLGYDISKRIAFLLGLCPFKTEIEQQDLNELIMYFLMHPCKSKQIPIRHLPQTFFRKDMPKEICQLMQKHLVDLPVAPVSLSSSPAGSSAKKQPEINVMEDESSTSVPFRQKAKKSFKSACLPPVQRKGLSPSISTLPLSAPKPLVKPLKPFQPVLIPGATNKIFLPALPALGQSPQPSLQKAILRTPSPTITIPSIPNAPQEVLIQQQTPDGQQKTFKLVKYPGNQNVHSVLKPPSQQTPLTVPAPIVQNKPITFTQPVQVNPIISGPLPPGLIFFKGGPQVAVSQSLPNIMQTVPVVLSQTPMNVNPIVGTVTNPVSQEKVITPDEKSDVPVECEYGEDNVEELNPLADNNPPTDEDLFNSIQEVIHSSDFENITLKNVIDRVAAQYSAFDLTHRHTYMKECIKKIIMGT